MTSQNKQSRYSWIDYARGIAIALVVYRHAFEGIKRGGFDASRYLYLEYANIVFFSFRMPLFFIVSGIFISGSLAKRGFNALLNNKLRTILYPYFLWGALQVTIQILFSSYLSAERNVSHYLYLFYIPREVEQFWYLYALFNVTILYALVKSTVRLSIHHQLALGLALYLFSAIASQRHLDLGFVNDICHYYLFFAIGDAVAGFIRDPRSEKWLASWKLFFILLPVFAASQVYFLLVNLDHGSDKYLYVEYSQPLVYLVIALVGCLFVANICFMLQQRGAADVIRKVGTYSLYIYVCHVMVTSCSRILAHRLLGVNSVPVLLAICFVLGLTVPILIYRLAIRLGMPWLFSLEKKEQPRPKQEKMLAQNQPIAL